MIQVYGIKNCDTVKKALKHLDQRKVSYEFNDFKKSPPTPAQIKKWKKAMADWPVNKKGRTYREYKEEFEGGGDAVRLRLLIENSSMIKRPIVERENGSVTFGYDKESFDAI